MTGDLILNGAPTADNQAATKAYVDEHAGNGKTLVYSQSINVPSGDSTKYFNVPTTVLRDDSLTFILETNHTSGSNINLTQIGSTILSTAVGLEYPLTRIIMPIVTLSRVPYGSGSTLGLIRFQFTFPSLFVVGVNATLTGATITFGFRCTSTNGGTLNCNFYVM